MANTLLIEEFIEFVTLNVQSRNEKAIAASIKEKLMALGLEVTEDDTAAKVNGNAGNIIARLKGDPGIPAVLFSAHMDRVANNGCVQPVVDAENGIIVSSGDTILAADDVAGICAILEGLRKVTASSILHGDIEIVITVCEEVGVLGSRYLDFNRFKAKMAYVFDAPGRFGRIINQGPTKCKIKIGVKGRSAHAGNEPEKGINAIKVAAIALSQIREGRISPCTTSNFGIFQAGTSTNVVCDYAEIIGEARSTKANELEQYLIEMGNCFQTIAKQYQTEVTVQTEILYDTFRIEEAAPISQIASNAMRQLGVEPVFATSGGGMDGNRFNKQGIPSIGIATGYFGNHTKDEHVYIDDMQKAGEFVAELVKAVSKFA
ncbi:MAG: tripeptide aminopeptidase [Clostridiales bacterium]|jgi:tripeptide aminopeptidase|nr:tripeptide aminopeptidase [Clostridiales bacterium]MDN5299785.1 tripeptide aminopeptidase [Clostridiales bacterium]